MPVSSRNIIGEIKEIVYERSGFYFSSSMEGILKNGIKKRMRELAVENEEEYLYFIKYEKKGNEIYELLLLFSSMVPIFLKDKSQFDAIKDVILPRWNKNHINALVPLSGKGEDIYSIAMVLDDWKESENGTYNIYGISHSTNAIDMINTEEYDEISLQYVPVEWREKYFHITDDKRFVLEKEKFNIEWRIGNLQDMELPNNIDIIMCRNTLIFYDDIMRRKILLNFYDILNEDGFLFVGINESIKKVTNVYKMVLFNNCVGYRKRRIR